MSTSRTALRITICGIPELGEHSAAGVTHVLSILGPNSPDPPEFAAFAPHRRLILRFHDVIEPQPDQIAPTREDVERLLVNQAYFRSYAQDLGAAVFQNMMFLQSPIPVPSGDPDRDVDFKRLVQGCRLHGILADILKSPLELLHYLANDPRLIAASVEASGGVRKSELANYMLPMKPATRSYTIPPAASAIKILICAIIKVALPTKASRGATHRP